MKGKEKSKRKEKNKINMVATILPYINNETYKKIKGRKRLHNIKDTYIYE